MKKFIPRTLFGWVLLATVAFLALFMYINISDPCVRFQDNGYTTLGGYLHKDMECVERKSGWKAAAVVPIGARESIR